MQYKILYLHGITAIGGAERDLLAILNELDMKQFTPLVVCPDRGPLVQELEKCGIMPIILPLPPWRKMRSLPFLLPAVYRLYRLIRQKGIQLIHINDMWWVPHGYWASRLAGIPCIAHIRQELETRRIQQYWLHYPQILIAVSACIGKTLERGGIDPEHIRVLYSGINLPPIPLYSNGQMIREKYKLKQDQPVIGTVANLAPRKGYEYLIQAMADIRKAFPDIRCLIIGEGNPEYTTNLKALAGAYGLSNHLIFMGHQQDVFSCLMAMEIVILPSIMEGFGIALLEAMAMAKPVIATRVGGILEIVDDGVTGILVPPKDYRILAAEVIRLLKDSELQRRMGEAGEKRVYECFTAKRMGRQLAELYHELLG